MTAPLSLAEGGSLYDRIGPEALASLVRRFYTHVARDPDLAPIFPDDLTHTAEKQFAFLSGFLGGPPLYHQRYGHPRLRARHLPFEITPTRGRAWLACMNAALRETPEIGEAEARELYAALARVAVHMVNAPDTSAPN
ncbi:hemoglobin [Deinococcus sp. HSC-46F16]|uniref:globin domain-containing protein n=1 Tax=Deinococcus sp. HSC-46F16 TaxID=2910968 RepID=UPI0020A1360B|nr:globin [Deinococcus sp. HSC-46F16]MCP2013826.1 hemoglobin [Deinococcus sp. HSC-46F16]